LTFAPALTARLAAVCRSGVPICLLTTTGKQSGLPRVAPLLLMADGERVVVVASQGRLPTNSQRYRNLQADPEVQVEFQGKRRRMLARTANADERAQLRPRLVRCTETSSPTTHGPTGRSSS
jgi:F420H(2)-dependent quinone reductase